MLLLTYSFMCYSKALKQKVWSVFLVVSLLSIPVFQCDGFLNVFEKWRGWETREDGRKIGLERGGREICLLFTPQISTTAGLVWGWSQELEPNAVLPSVWKESNCLGSYCYLLGSALAGRGNQERGLHISSVMWDVGIFADVSAALSIMHFMTKMQ